MTQIPDHVLKRRVFKQDVNDRLMKTTIMGLLDSYVDPEKCAIDVGAAAGHFTHYFAQRASWVYAYEPSPSFEELKKKEQEFPNVMCDQVAIGHHSRENVDFYIDDKRLSNSGFQDLVEGQKTKVEVVALDDIFVGDKIGFIKIDVEGTELDVLHGAARTLFTDKPNLLVEIYEPYSKYAIESIFEFLMPWYECCYCYNGENPSLQTVFSVEDGVNAVRTRHNLHDGDFLFVA